MRRTTAPPGLEPSPTENRVARRARQFDPAAALMSPQDLADYLSVPIGTVYRWNHVGSGPPALSVGRHVRYRPEEVEAWLDTQRQVP